jgi:hypothetical protein
MKRVGIVVLFGLTLAGCAGLQSSDTRAAERALTAAGFQVHPADTPEKLAELRALRPRTILRQPHDGEDQYVYADPSGCHCLYVGGEPQYQALRRQQAAVIDRYFAVEGNGDTMDWGVWSIAPR